jgi:general L-amino acid transport system substrate-binding protein
MIVPRHAGIRVALVYLAAVIALCAQAGAAGAGVLQTVRERGHVVCGVSDRLPGLSTVDRSGRWSGLEIEFCGALAAAVFGERDRVKFRPMSALEGARSLAEGDIDVLLGGTSWTLSREADLGIRFAGVLFYEGQGLLVPRSFGVSSVLELSGASVCVQEGTGAEKSLSSYFDTRRMRYQLVRGKEWADTVKAYKDGTCTLLTGDLPALAHERMGLAKPLDHILLPEIIAQEETGPFVRQGDDPWFTVVRWTLLALIEAEQLGVSSLSISKLPQTPDLRVRRFLGRDGALAASLGLQQDWTEKVIASVGNYGEVFNRTMGEGSRLKLPRGENQLWTEGGLMISPQFR